MPQESTDEIFDDATGDVAIGDLDSAVEKYRRCVQLDPDFFDGWHALGMALMKLGRFEEAIEAGKRLTIRSAGQVFHCFTIAPATLRKRKPPARRPKS
jgi:Flp pilus assembly protein TadD